MTKIQILIEFIEAHPVDIMWEAIHCDTKEKAEDLVGMFYALDYRWENDDLAQKHFKEDGTITTKWEEKGKNTCYSITPTKIILFGSKSFYEVQEKHIVTYEEMFGEAEDFNVQIDKSLLLQDFKKEVEVVKVEELPQRYCPQCGNILLNNGEKFCMECGFRIPENFFVQEASKSEPPNPESTSAIPNIIQQDQQTSQTSPTQVFTIPSVVDNPVQEVENNSQQLPAKADFSVQNTTNVQEIPKNQDNVNDSLLKDKKSSNHLTNKLLIVLSIFVIIALGLFVGQYFVGNNMDNDYGKFSSSWQKIELVTQTDTEESSNSTESTENTETETAEAAE